MCRATTHNINAVLMAGIRCASLTNKMSILVCNCSRLWRQAQEMFTDSTGIKTMRLKLDKQKGTGGWQRTLLSRRASLPRVITIIDSQVNNSWINRVFSNTGWCFWTTIMKAVESLFCVCRITYHVILIIRSPRRGDKGGVKGYTINMTTYLPLKFPE